LIDQQIAQLNGLIAQAMKPHQDAVIRCPSALSRSREDLA
jgi:hypothetical protein